MLTKTSTSTTAVAAATEPRFWLTDSSIVELTPELLKEFRALIATTTEREVRRSHVKFLREKLNAQQLTAFQWATATVKGGKKRRVNGQHSSTMLHEAAADGVFPTGLKVFLANYECVDDDAACELFMQFDARPSSRSSQDVAAVYQGQQADLADLDKKLAKIAIDGFHWHQRAVEKLPLPIDDSKYSLFGDQGLHPFIRFFVEIHSTKTEELAKREIAAAVYATFAANELAAREFWPKVAAPDVDDATAPATMLDDFLERIHAGTLDPDNFGGGSYYQACVYAWNAWRDSKAIQAIRWEVKKNLPAVKE